MSNIPILIQFKYFRLDFIGQMFILAMFFSYVFIIIIYLITIIIYSIIIVIYLIIY